MTDVALWRLVTGTPGPDRLLPVEEARIARAASALSRGFLGAWYGQTYLNDPDLLGAYLLAFAPVSQAQVAAALRLGAVRGPGRVLDLGSGPGPAALAARTAGFHSVTVADHSERALDLAAARIAGAHTVRWQAGDPVPAGPFDLVVASHAMCEWFRGARDRVAARADLLGVVAETLAPGGRIVLVEPARHDVNAELLALRDHLAAAGWRIDAPCPRTGPCPARVVRAACHATADWRPSPQVAHLRQLARLDREALAFGWLVVRPPHAQASRYPSAQLRVVSEPLRNKAGRMRVLTCGPEGRLAVTGPATPQWWPERGAWIDVGEAERTETGWRLRKA